MKHVKQPVQNEKGMALPVTLIVLLVAGLLIASSLSFASTSLSSIRSEQKNVKGLYAADAGIEDVLWSLKKVQPQPTPTILPLQEGINGINGLSVTMQTVDKGAYVLNGTGDFVDKSTSQKYEYIDVGSLVEGPVSNTTYKYTITIIRGAQAVGTVWIAGVGARLPIGYSYKSGSADIQGNLCRLPPSSDLPDDAGARMLNWEFTKDKVDIGRNIGDTKTQTFYITGTGSLDNYYAWAWILNFNSVISELGGNFYQITAIAKQDAATVANVTADVMTGSGNITIISWRIN